MEMTKPVNLDSKISEIVDALSYNKPVCLYGPTGTGKTIAGWEAAQRIAKALGNEVVYIQMYPEITKSVLIGGETIKNGNIVVDTGPIIKMGGSETKNGATFFIDEVTHATEPAVLGLNSLIEAPFQTVVGAKVYKMHENTSFLFAGNTSLAWRLCQGPLEATIGGVLGMILGVLCWYIPHHTQVEYLF